MATKEKYALITGATSGIGLELAKLFAKDKYNLVIVARSQEELDKTSTELSKEGITVITMAKDLFEHHTAAEIYNEVKQRGINLDVLVNNAGQGYYGLFANNDLRRELDIIHLNIISLVALTKLFLNDMLSRGEGKILNLSSIASQSPGPWNAVYHATKAFVQSFTEAVRVETKDTGISLTALLPGVTDTDFFRKAGMLSSKVAQDKDKMADPADVAKVGYEALMAGKDQVIHGVKNKIQVSMNGLNSDEKNAEKMAKQQEPVGNEKKGHVET
jgi:short-subunit dehydrogenase